MPPLTLLIKPASGLCNMRCAYCFYADVTEHREAPSYGMMAEEMLEAIVEEALAAAEGSCTFAFQGGEPTLRGLPFFERLIRLQKKHNVRGLSIHNAIQTNGLLIDDRWASFLAENRFLVGLSLDGDAAIHNAQREDAKGKGTYARVMRAADILRGSGCDYNILCVVTARAARHPARVYNHLKRHRYLQFIPCIDGFGEEKAAFSLTAEAYGHFLKATFDLYFHDYTHGEYVSVRTFDNYVHMLMGRPPENCAMNGRCACNLVIEADGGVYPCDFYVLDAWRLGTVGQAPLLSLCAGETARRFVALSHAPDAACLSCDWRALCRGGCRRDREIGVEDALGRNRFCESYRAFFAYSHERMRALAAHARR